MAIWETERLVRALFEVAFPIKQIYVNQVQPENEACSYCMNRFKDQLDKLKKIHELYSEFDLIEIPTFEEEIRGISKLRELGTRLYAK
jgi:arsenite-transporting ATPase